MIISQAHYFTKSKIIILRCENDLIFDDGTIRAGLKVDAIPTKEWAEKWLKANNINLSLETVEA